MKQIFYNKNFTSDHTKISVFDRGFLFGDAVYEVFAVLDSLVLENQAHLDRLQRSLQEIDLVCPLTSEEIISVQQQLIEKNNLVEGGIYLQISRGPADRDFAFPVNSTPTVVMFTQAKNLINSPSALNGIRVVTSPDLRWARRDIKTVQLLGACLAKQDAIKQGKDDAWMVEDGFVTEGTSNTAYILKGKTLVTRQLGHEILPGITRASVLELARCENLSIEERPFSIAEAVNADEAFMTAATAFVTPVIEIDNQCIGTGKPGPVTQRLRDIYIQIARQHAA